MSDEQQQPRNTKKILLTGGVVFVVVLLIGLGIYFFMKRGAPTTTTTTGGVFGVAENNANKNTSTNVGEKVPEPDGASATQGEALLFRQLSTIPTTGVITVTQQGKTFVRYVSREKGFVFQVDPQTGETTQLTNTTIPRIHEALWAAGGNAVILRSLAQDAITGADVIKTYLAYLTLPATVGTSTDSAVGSLRGSYLPDNITAISVAPNGNALFYLLPTPDGVSGTIVTVNTKVAKEVLRSTFSEWTPELLNNGSVMLTTKPSAKIPGFSYLYDTNAKTFTKLLREKNGLTTHVAPAGTRLLYSENISANLLLGTYDRKGFAGDEGIISHESGISLATLPEKCAWGKGALVVCGAFTPTQGSGIPDEWYRGEMSFSDSFWLVNTNTSEIKFLADPVEAIKKQFDVTSPALISDGNTMLFIDKNDGTLWAFYLPSDKAQNTDNIDLTGLSPEEIKDVLGSASAPTSTVKKKK